MITIGLTGGMGSGKSTVALIFNHIGIPVFYADIEARQCYLDEKIKKKLYVYFNNIIFDDKGNVHTKKLADIIFKDKQALEFITQLIHPLVRDKFSAWSFEHIHTPYVIFESAILFESGFNQQMNKIITVTSPKKIRIKRIMLRDQLSVEEIELRMQHQFPDDVLIHQSDFVIRNNEDTFLIPQVLAIHKKIHPF